VPRVPLVYTSSYKNLDNRTMPMCYFKHMVRQTTLTSAERIVDRFLQAYVHTGSLEVYYPSGYSKRYGDNGNPVEVAIRKLPLSGLRNPDLFFGEAYMRGDLQIPENQLDAFFRLMPANRSDSLPLRLIQKLPKRQHNHYRAQPRQISHHYDVGNDYYRLWLDKTLTYSCAYFNKPGDSLERAQQQKIDHVLKKLRPEPGQQLLDIGSGWGHLAVTAARKYGVTVLGITLSLEQLAGSRELAAKLKLADRVRFELMNYQDLPAGAQFDRIVSVGMYEHVGRGNHEAYFKKIQQLLTDEGVSVLHTITDTTNKKPSPWIDKYIFPGGYLPTVSSIETLLEKFRFWSIDRENLWQHYALTLNHWRARHQAHRQEIIRMYGESFYRMRDFWLAGSTAAFRYGDIGLAQFVFTKNKSAPGGWPLTRRYLYK
jgi:cyclopropane-fatty-acyl-phospholipid synthase